MQPFLHVIAISILVREYFSFCGEIKELTINEAIDGTRQATILFESESGASTACLITGAMIDGQSISVDVIVDTSSSASKPVLPPRPDSAKGLVAESKVMAEKMGRSIKNVDEQYGISAGAKSALSAGVTKAKEVNERLHITEKASAATQAAREKAAQLNEQYAISQRMSAMGSSVASFFGFQGRKQSPNSSSATG